MAEGTKREFMTEEIKHECKTEDVKQESMTEETNKNRKKIVLAALNASYVHSNPALYALRRSAYTFLCKKDSTPPQIELAEYTINDRYEDILFDLIEREADVYGFSVYIWNAQLCRQLLEDLRRLYPTGRGRETQKSAALFAGGSEAEARGRESRKAVYLFAGGPEAETHPEQYLTSCDFVMTGPGEYPFSIFCEKMVWEELPGAVFYKDGKLQKVPQAEKARRGFAEEIPFLYDGTEDFEHRIIYYETSRGCPFRCTYCLSSGETGVIFRDMDTVKKELRYFLDRKAALVKFVDRTFNANAAKAREIWDFIRENDNGITGFHFEIGADLLKEEDLALLRQLRPGLIQLEIGIQSTHPKTLEAIRRTADNDRIFRAVTALLENENMALHTDLIVGLPFESYAVFKKSFNDVYALRAHQFQVGFLKVLAGTEMDRKAREYGIICSARPPYTVLETKWITPHEVDRIRRIADMVEIFWNAGLFRHALPYLETLFESPFAMYEALTVYYKEQKGSGALSPRGRGAFLEAFAENAFAKSTPANGSAPAFDLSHLGELLRFDERLHFHPSRKMSARDTFRKKDGTTVTIEFDYTKTHPVTKEAAYRIPESGEEAHSERKA